MSKNIGAKIKEIRQENGISRQDLSKKLGISIHTLSKYEQGQRKPNMDILLKIASSLNTSIFNFIIAEQSDVIESANNTAQKATDIAKEFKDYGDSWREAVLKIESIPEYLLNSILNYLENTEEYYSSIFVNLPLDESSKDNIDPDIAYLNSEQVKDIVNKITELVKYELYKIENNK